MRLDLYTVFHLNMMYSSIEEQQRPEVVERCYWPLLRLVEQYRLPLGIEAPALTLEIVQSIDPRWIETLRRLAISGACEFVGSGYAQVIGPLVPASINAANQRLGQQAYERLLGLCPRVALVNEQAYSAGMVRHYLDAGYRAIVMEWDNPARCHPAWDPEWRYLPQVACGQPGEEIPLIWNKSIAFQKLQRYAHGEMELDEYLDYLRRHLAETPRVFPLYGNDVEVFDFRPGRYETEARLQNDGEWQRIGRLFEALLVDRCFRFIPPGQVLDLLDVPGAGNRLHLESPESPVPVKKQGKYNITRWAVTGRDDLGINTVCRRSQRALEAGVHDDGDWQELCYLWSSDFRTHITEQRWTAFRQRLAAFERRAGGGGPLERASMPAFHAHAASDVRVEQAGRYLEVETDSLRLRLNPQRGLAVDGLWFKMVCDRPLVGTLPHGYYDDIALGADFYTGHLILESPGRAKITDLSPVKPAIEQGTGCVHVSGVVATALGPVRKRISVGAETARVELTYWLEWDQVPAGSLRLGHVTLDPSAFDRETLFFSTHNGGFDSECFRLGAGDVDHGSPVSFLVSASQGIGVTGGLIDLGDASHRIRVQLEPESPALIGLVTCRPVGTTYFCRLALSAREMDETSRPDVETPTVIGRPIRLSLMPGE